jgi:hypothetical protein
MLGCSPGEGGKGRGMGLTGGNPGEVCCGVPRALEALGYASLATGSLASGSAAGRFGVGASGKVSSAAAISGGSVAVKRATGRSATGRSSGGGGVGVRSARGFRCALAPQQASEVRPTRVGTSRAHLRSRPRCISGVPVLLIRTKIRGDMSRGFTDCGGRPDGAGRGRIRGSVCSPYRLRPRWQSRMRQPRPLH